MKKDIMEEKNQMSGYNKNEYEYDACEYEEKQLPDYKNLLNEANIYSMGYKEFQIYIYYQLEEIKSSLSSILDVERRK